MSSYPPAEAGPPQSNSDRIAQIDSIVPVFTIVTSFARKLIQNIPHIGNRLREDGHLRIKANEHLVCALQVGGIVRPGRPDGAC